MAVEWGMWVMVVLVGKEQEMEELKGLVESVDACWRSMGVSVMEPDPGLEGGGPW